MASYVIPQILLIIYNSYTELIQQLMCTSIQHYCLVFSNIYENISGIWSEFPQISGKIPPTSGHSDWLNYPRMPYRVEVEGGGVIINMGSQYWERMGRGEADLLKGEGFTSGPFDNNIDEFCWTVLV